MKIKKNKNKKGFTMIEMLAVFIIIGVLSSIGVISYLNFQKQQEAKFDAAQLQIFKQTGKNFFGDKKIVCLLFMVIKKEFIWKT